MNMEMLIAWHSLSPNDVDVVVTADGSLFQLMIIFFSAIGTSQATREKICTKKGEKNENHVRWSDDDG